MKMEPLIQTAVIFFGIAIAMLLIGGIGYEIDSYITKKLGEDYKNRSLIKVTETSVYTSNYDFDLVPGSSIIAVTGDGKKHVIVGAIPDWMKFEEQTKV